MDEEESTVFLNKEAQDQSEHVHTNESQHIVPTDKEQSSLGDNYGSTMTGATNHALNDLRGPRTLKFSQRRDIRNAQLMQFKELESGLNTNYQISAKIAKFINRSSKKLKEIQRNYFRIWGSSLKDIEGRLGSGVCTYFKVIVWLLKINLFCMILGLGLIVGPGGYMKSHPESYDIENTTYNKDDMVCTNPNFVSGTGTHADAFNSVLQLFTGTGWMESTAMFYGWYPTSNLTKDTEGEKKTVYYFSLVYFTVGVSYFLLSLIFLLYNLSKQFNKSAAEQFESKPYSSEIFIWDYGIEDIQTSEQLQIMKIQSLKEELTEDAQEGLKREFWTKVGIFFLRIFTNAICIAVMVGTVYLYVDQVLTQSSESQANLTDSCGNNKDVSLQALDFFNFTGVDVTEHLSAFWNTYAASIIVSGSNVVLPVIFDLVAAFEMYQVQSTRVAITLLRMFIMKLFNISTYLYILYIAVGPSGGRIEAWQTPENTLFYNCWEDYIASQLYQLVMIDFCVFCLVLLLAEVLRSFLVARSSFLRDRLGITKREFNIAAEILDLVHKQMIVWSGFYFAPLFPVIAVIEVIAIFYLKKASSLRNVIPPKTVVLNHQSTFTVSCLFFISLLLVFGFMGLIIFNFHPSTTCGPFRDSTKFSDPLSAVIEQSVVFNFVVDNLKSTVVFTILVILVWLVIYYYRSLASSRKVTNDLLRQQVKNEIADKKFILEQLLDTKSKKKEATLNQDSQELKVKRKQLRKKMSRLHSFASSSDAYD